MLEEKISKNLGVKYVYLPDKKFFICENGVPFTLEEYKKGINLQTEYIRRKNENTLYDYTYAKSTGLLRKKRGTAKVQEVEKREAISDENNRGTDNSLQSKDVYSSSENAGRGEAQAVSEEYHEISRRNNNSVDRPKETERKSGSSAVGFIIALLAFTSIISGYISTLQTATYLYDYVDIISAWLMSSSVTAYNVTAFEVAVLFKQNKRYGLTFVFITLWTIVTLFSMATAVSVFYDRFNFNEYQTAEENKAVDSSKLELEMLRTKESDLREAIAFKKKDIEYRQEKDYATSAVRKELVDLEAELQANLTQQQNLLSETPQVTEEVMKRKERLFAVLGRLLHVDSGVFEFIMSTLSAIFVNLIAPMSLVAVTELRKKRLTK